MKDTVRVEIDAPQEKVARLFADPRNSAKWMEKTRYEPISETRYRLVMDGGMTFTATVVSRDLPTAARLRLEAPNVNVDVTATFVALGASRTELVSVEVFAFKGIFQKLFSLVARPAIRRAHRRQMEAFKRFAEQS